MEVGPHQDPRCLHCRVDDMEDWLTALSGTVAWSLLALMAWAAWRLGVFAPLGEVMVRHG